MSAEKPVTEEKTMAVERWKEERVALPEAPVVEKLADSDPAAEATRRILDKNRIETVREELSKGVDVQAHSTVIPVSFEKAATFVLQVGEKAEQKKRSAGPVKRFILLALAALGIHGGDLKAQHDTHDGSNINPMNGAVLGVEKQSQGTNFVYKEQRVFPPGAPVEQAKGTNTNPSLDNRAGAPGMVTFSNTNASVDNRAGAPGMVTFSNLNNMRGIGDPSQSGAFNNAPQNAPGNYYAQPNLNEQNRQQTGSVEKPLPAVLDPVGALGRFMQKKFPSAQVREYGQPVGPGLEVRETGSSGSWELRAQVPGKPTLEGRGSTTNYEAGFDKQNKKQFYIRP